MFGRVAQLVERGIENPCVGGSTPSPATFLPRVLLLLVVLGAGCGDRCETLCVAAADRVAECRTPPLAWADLGARSRADFTTQCRQEWDGAYAELEPHEQELALDICRDGLEVLDELTCSEIVALYALGE